MFLLVYINTPLQLTLIKLFYAETEETIKIFHLQYTFARCFCASFEDRKDFTETQAVKPWLKIY